MNEKAITRYFKKSNLFGYTKVKNLYYLCDGNSIVRVPKSIVKILPEEKSDTSNILKTITVFKNKTPVYIDIKNIKKDIKIIHGHTYKKIQKNYYRLDHIRKIMNVLELDRVRVINIKNKGLFFFKHRKIYAVLLPLTFRWKWRFRK